MKTGIISLILENYISFLTICIIIIFAIAILDKEEDSQPNVKKTKNNFLPQIDLKSSRVGAVAIIILLFLFWFICK